MKWNGFNKLTESKEAGFHMDYIERFHENVYSEKNNRKSSRRKQEKFKASLVTFHRWIGHKKPHYTKLTFKKTKKNYQRTYHLFYAESHFTLK